MATPTSSSNRSKRKGTKPITQGQNPQRSNRQKVSNAQVTNSNTRGSNAGSAKVTSSSTPAPKPAPVQRRTRVNGKVKPGMVQRNQVGQPKVQRQGPTTSNVPPRATPQPPAKPSGNFKAPSIPKPKPAAPKPNALARNLRFGRGNAAMMALGAANAADDARLTPAQRAKKYEVVNPDRGQNLLTKLQSGTLGKPNTSVKRDPNGRSSTGVRVSDKANQRDYNAAPTGSQQYNDYRNRQIAAERERLRGVGNPSKEKPKPPAEPPRRQEFGSSQRLGNNSAPRSQTPPAPRFTGTVDEGRQKWAEKYSSSKYEGQAIQKEAKKLLDEMKKRKEDKSNATKAGWDGNKNY